MDSLGNEKMLAMILTELPFQTQNVQMITEKEVFAGILYNYEMIYMIMVDDIKFYQCEDK